MFEIQEATQIDCEPIVRLSYALFQEDAGTRDHTVNLEWAKAHGQAHYSQMIDSPQAVCFVAVVGKKMVGFLAGYTREATDTRLVKTADLQSLYIEEAFRGQGLGTALTQQFVNWTSAQQVDTVTVSAYYANQKAVDFYQKLGFAPKNITLSLTHQSG